MLIVWRRRVAQFGTTIDGWHYKYGGTDPMFQDQHRYHSAHSSHNAKDGRWFVTSPFFDTKDPEGTSFPCVAWEKELLATD